MCVVWLLDLLCVLRLDFLIDWFLLLLLLLYYPFILTKGFCNVDNTIGFFTDVLYTSVFLITSINDGLYNKICENNGLMKIITSFTLLCRLF